MSVVEPERRLDRCCLLVLEFEYDVPNAKESSHILAGCTNRIPTYADTTIEIDPDVPCFFAEREYFPENFQSDESVVAEFPTIDSIYQWKLLQDTKLSAIAHDELLRE